MLRTLLDRSINRNKSLLQDVDCNVARIRLDLESERTELVLLGTWYQVKGTVRMR